MSSSQHDELVGRFAFRDPALLFARATLTDEHLALTGWTWRGRYRRHIPLDRILHVDVPENENLVLWLFDGEVLRLRIERAPTWKRAIEASVEHASITDAKSPPLS